MKKLLSTSACLLLLAASCSQNKVSESAQYAPFATAEEKVEAIKELLVAHGWKLRTDISADSMQTLLLELDYDRLRQAPRTDTIILHQVTDPELRDSILRLGEELEKAGRIQASDEPLDEVVVELPK